MTFIRPLSVDDPAIGGKARSLARLAALGLPTPAGFAVDVGLSRALRAGGPALPRQLRTPDDVATLEAARGALLAAPLGAAFERALDAALAALDPTGDPASTFSVRSSAPSEDAADHAAPGIFDSCVGVRRADVAGAVKTVLASALSPAAFHYALRRPDPSTELAVLVHRFVDATAQGAASGAPAIVVDAQQGTATDAARVTIRDAVAAASARFGPSELEWAAQGDHVTFLQLRPFRPAPPVIAGDSAVATDDGWRWDAAHNPAPLSPAQAGLVALVDERCPTGVRQEVRGGYLFFARAPHAEQAPTPSPRALFERLTADVDARLRALTEPPRLQAALELYLAAYTPLFGAIQPACSQARAALKAFLARAFPDGDASGPALTAGVACAATLRATLAAAIAEARDAATRQAAIDDYLRAFGDESPRWDVAEPTFREVPERLLFLGVAESGASSPPPRTEARAGATAATLAARLPAAERDAFVALLTAAREAVAVGEDDDHLFARLQAVVRRALLALGERLVATRRLSAVDDVFFLPLSVARALDEAPRALDALDLGSLAAAARRALAEAAGAPPLLATARALAGGSLAGVSGSPGLAIGRAVHHPSATPLKADAILIAMTLLPTELPLLNPAALVVETGTPLGHVAAQARERGLPAVVSAHGARAAIREGQLLIVDATRGQITLVDDP
jgi:phosphohistidine swiveling domain-containing protein